MEDEKAVLTIDDIKIAIINDARDLNTCCYNAVTMTGVIYSLVSRILIYLSIYSGLRVALHFFNSQFGDGDLYFEILSISLGILILISVWNKSYKKYLIEKLKDDKMHIAAVYFSKTKEFTQEEWIKNKIFENEIMPLIQ